MQKDLWFDYWSGHSLNWEKCRFLCRYQSMIEFKIKYLHIHRLIRVPVLRYILLSCLYSSPDVIANKVIGVNIVGWLLVQVAQQEKRRQFKPKRSLARLPNLYFIYVSEFSNEAIKLHIPFPIFQTCLSSFKFKNRGYLFAPIIYP